MPRFVILVHSPGPRSIRPLHWDFMVEDGDQLLTWALVREPTYDVEIEAEELAPHRLAYLELEGEISDGRGIVTRWDRGVCRWLERSAARLVMAVHGDILHGEVDLVAATGLSQRWVMSCRRSSSADGLRTTAF